MNKPSRTVALAFANGRKGRGNNTVTDGTQVHLHGKRIAWIQPGEGVHFSLCGWPTTTTKARLNAIFAALDLPLRICTIKREPHVYNYKTGHKEKISSRLPYAVTDFV